MALTRTPQTDSKTKLGRYELLRELAASSVGTSWLARPIGETFEVTLLKVHRHMAKTPAAVESLLSEAQAARKFAHDNVAGVLDAGVVDGEPFIVTEYVGESLASLLRAAGPAGLPIPIALRISLDILEGFAAAHTHDPPIGHGEIGPWCVFVGSDGVARVGGFGVDQAIWRFGAHYVKNMERLSYAAPERVKSMSTTLAQELSVADEQSDLFGAAVLVFELLTRQRLFASKMEAAVVQKVLTSPIPTAQSFRPEIPLEVSDALKQALVRDRSERIVCFEDFIVALEGAGPELIGSNEAVAEMVGIAASGKSTDVRSVPPPPAFLMNAPGSIHEMLSSAGTPGAATKPAPVPGRATLMFDEIKDDLSAPRVSGPNPFATTVAASSPTPAAAAKPANTLPTPPVSPIAAAAASTMVSAGSVSAAVASATAAKPATNGGPVRTRAKTLMGFGALKVGPPASQATPTPSPTKEVPAAPPKPKESPVAPVVTAKPQAIEIPSARSSSIELDDGDFDVQIEDPLAFPTTVVELPIGGAKVGALAASPASSKVVTQAFSFTSEPTPSPDDAKAPPKAAKAPVRRTSTLLGLHASQVLEAKDASKDIDVDTSFEDEPTRNMLDEESTTVDPVQAKAPAPKSPAPSAVRPAPAPVTPPPPVQHLPAPSVATSTEANDVAKKTDEPKKLGKRALFSNEMLRTGAVLHVSGTGFELIAPVARGGMATVWAAREVGSKGLEKMVGIKTMLPELSDDVDFESMFLDEARVAAKIRHPNVAAIIDLGQEDSLLYLVMEWVDGENVGTIQRSARVMGGMPTPVIMNIAAAICSGLHEAHELKDEHGHSLEVVHRDISPANVLVARDGRTKIVDFGIAKSKGRLHVTKVGAMVKGKTPYLSPEQIGGLAIDRRSDLFSLGALLYVMSSGLHPFRGETELSTIENIAIKAPVPLRSIVPDIDPAFEQIVLKLLEKDPKKRFQTAREVQDALEKLSQTMPNRASQEDVAAFLEKVVGDKLDQRIEMLKAGLERMERRAEGAGPDPYLQENTPSPASALQQVLQRVRQSQPDALNAISFADPSPAVANEATAQPDSSKIEPPASVPSPLSSPVASSATATTSETASSSQEFAEEPVEAPPRSSNVKRLAILIGVGLVIGLAIIGALETFRGDSSTSPTATASAGPTSAPTAEPTAAPTNPTSSPTTAATPTSEPTTEPTAAPTETAAQPTAEPSTAPTSATPPNQHVTPGPGTKPFTQHPPVPGKPKPPIRKYNPSTI